MLLEGQGGGPSLSVQGGALWQTDLSRDSGVGTFVAVDGRFMVSRIHISSSASDKTLTPSQAALLTTTSNDFVTDVTFRGGPVGKLGFLSLTFYGLGAIQGEWGPYFDYRHRVDGIGNFYNNADTPVTPGLGFGLDLSFSSKNSWSLGATTEMIAMISANQSYFEVNDGNGSSKHGVTAALPTAIVFKPHFDIGNYSVFGCFSVDIFGAAGDSMTGGVSYRW